MNHYPQYCDLLRELHQLIADGKGESAEAESFRDAMDVHWRMMTANQRDQVRVLSVALYGAKEESLRSNDPQAP